MRTREDRASEARGEQRRDDGDGSAVEVGIQTEFSPLSPLVSTSTQVTVSVKSQSTQSHSVQLSDFALQAEALVAESGAQTEAFVAEHLEQDTQTGPVGAPGNWRRLFRLVRRVSSLRRTRAQLGDHVARYGGIYQRSA